MKKMNQDSQNHINEIDRIRETEDIVAKKTSLPVFNLSHWDTGKQYQEAISDVISLDFTASIYDYVYSYELNSKVKTSILSKYNIPINKTSIALVPSSTIAIINVCNFLQKNNCKNVCIIQPSYFSVELCLQSFNINTVSKQFQGSFLTPSIGELEEMASFDAIWLTLPIYGTGAYFSKEQLSAILTSNPKKQFVVLDETLSTIDAVHNLSIDNSPYLLRIVSPHKIIGTNAMKFSGIIHHKENANPINIGLDYLSGGLMSSSKIAISHFLSENYNACLAVSKRYIMDAYHKVEKLIHPHMPQFHYSSYGGPFMTIFYDGVPFEVSKRKKFIDDLIKSTNISLLPGYLEGFYEDFGFCFRINLTLDEEILFPSLLKIIRYLKKYYPA